RDRALRDQHPLAHPAAEHVERDETLAGALGLHLKEGAVRDLGQPAGGPDVAGHLRGKHQRSLSISTPAARARSPARRVSTPRRPPRPPPRPAGPPPRPPPPAPPGGRPAPPPGPRPGPAGPAAPPPAAHPAA